MKSCHMRYKLIDRSECENCPENYWDIGKATGQY